MVLGPDVAGFFDHSEYEDAKKRGDEAIRRMILRHLDRTSVTVVLIGTFTWLRPWVRFDISESIRRRNGLVGIQIHHLKDQYGQVSAAGPAPSVPAGVSFPVYTWESSPAAVRAFGQLIEDAGKRSDSLKALDSLLDWRTQ